jgi:hypothetical protein
MGWLWLGFGCSFARLTETETARRLAVELVTIHGIFECEERSAGKATSRHAGTQAVATAYQSTCKERERVGKGESSFKFVACVNANGLVGPIREQ